MYTIGQVLNEVVRMLYLNNFAKYPKLTVHNLILFGFMYYYFCINMFMQSQYTSILMKRSFTKDIDTMQELYDTQQEIYAFQNQIKEIKKIYTETNYSDIVERFKPVPQSEDLHELKRNGSYMLSIYAEEDVLPAFVINHDRAVFLSRSRVYRKNGKLWILK